MHMQDDAGVQRKERQPYSEEERAAAFGYFCGDGQRNLTKTSRDLDISLRTVNYWATHDEWRKRYRESILAIAANALDVARAEVQVSLSAAAAMLVRDATSLANTPSQRIAAWRELREFAESYLGNEGTDARTFIDARQVHVTPDDLKVMGHEDLTKEAAIAIEANVVKADAKAREGKRKQW